VPVAFTRAVSPRLADCELTHLVRTPIDIGVAIAQHAAYEKALVAVGFEVRRLPPLDDAPDGVFVEDTAIVLGRHAIITRPGAAPRRGETVSTAQALAGCMDVHRLSTGSIDGGDVLLIERTLYVGASLRTDAAGIDALRAAAAPLGYATVAVDLRDCLHLKTCATYAGRDAAGDPVVLVDPRHVDRSAFRDVDIVEVAPGEGAAANAVGALGALLIAAGYPRVRDLLSGRGFAPAELDTSEFRKAEAALTCLSLLAPDL
jgi:dimethylargininase